MSRAPIAPAPLPRRPRLAVAALAAVAAVAGTAHADDASLAALRDALAEQTRQLADLRRALAEQEARLSALQAGLRAREGDATPASAPVSPALPPQAAGTRAPAVAVATAAPAPAPAPIFEQPGVLTPAGKYTFEPSLQYAYSSSNRIALLGNVVIPAVLVGLVDVREVKRSTFTGAVALRHGVTNRFEVEAKLPYVWRSDDTVVRQTNGEQNSATSTAFNGRGRGIGDAEFTARYQLNAGGGADSAYYVGSLRLKTRTGVDPYQIPVSTSELDLRGDGAPSRLATGSGFVGLQPALTVLVPSDPAVIFGSVSWLHSFRRSNVVRPTDQGPEALGGIAPGGILGFNIGMGLALNDKSSFSIGYDHASIGKTRQNGLAAPDAVRVQLGTLLLGYSYRLDDRRSINFSLGAGLTRDTPDLALTLRTPTSF